MIRNKLLDEIRRDYVLLARAKGLGRTRVLLSHCLRNVLPTIVSIMAISIPHVLSGTYVAESVFNYPGIGLLAVSSAKYHAHGADHRSDGHAEQPCRAGRQRSHRSAHEVF